MASWNGKGRRTGRNFSVNTEMIDITSMTDSYKMDPTWSWTDPAGHEHQTSSVDETTQLWVVSSYWCQDCGEEHYEYDRFCTLCVAKVEVPMVLDVQAGTPQRIPGMTSYTIDDQPVDEETYRRELEKER